MFNVLEISRMTTHNGPGYRTNVHFMGCPLSCRWCSTPESQEMAGLGHNPDRCIGCGACASVCPTGAVSVEPGHQSVLDRGKCQLCYQCIQECYSLALWKYGTAMDLDTLLSELMKDAPFFKNSGGGVTFSGGECLLHVDGEMAALYAALHEKGISIGVDTCGCVPWENIERLLPYIDFFLWDIKKMDSAAHKELTGAGNELILSNLERVDRESSADLNIRYPLIPDLNDTDEDIRLLCEYLTTLKRVRELHFLPYHTMGLSRYRFCGKTYQLDGVEPQPPEKLQHILCIAEKYGVPCRIIG